MGQLDDKMQKAINNLKNNFATVRTGRANPELLNKVRVDYYGSSVPLQQVASITVQDSTALIVNPFDKNAVGDIERSIIRSDLGITPSNDGQNIRIIIPPLNEERRKNLEKIVRKMAEESRIAVRNIRREAMDKIKKDNDISDDDKKKEEGVVQKITDRFVASIDQHLKNKEKEIMEI